jgi:hypothetical protein
MRTSLKWRALSASMLSPAYVLALLCGAAIVLAFGKLRASNPQPPHHVYELRLYHAKEGKMDALEARFRDHTDAIFRRHNMRVLVTGRPKMRRIRRTYSSTYWSIPAGRKRRRIGLLSKLIRNGRK